MSFLLQRIRKSLKARALQLVSLVRHTDLDSVCFTSWSLTQCSQTQTFRFPGMIWISSGDIALFLNTGLEAITEIAPVQGSRWLPLKWPLAAAAELFPFSSLSFLPVSAFISDFLLFPSGSYSLSHPPEKKKYQQRAWAFRPSSSSSVPFLPPFHVPSLR